MKTLLDETFSGYEKVLADGKYNLDDHSFMLDIAAQLDRSKKKTRSELDDLKESMQ